jgi:hypothetical protein
VISPTETQTQWDNGHQRSKLTNANEINYSGNVPPDHCRLVPSDQTPRLDRPFDNFGVKQVNNQPHQTNPKWIGWTMSTHHGMKWNVWNWLCTSVTARSELKPLAALRPRAASSVEE